MQPAEIRKLSENLAEQMRRKLGFRGRGLKGTLDYGKRLLPKAVRKAAEQIATAEERAANPKLMKHIDADTLLKAKRICERYLGSVDADARRKQRRIEGLSVFAFNLGLFLLLFLAFLMWRGIV
ncbi:MAG: hypothetical protein AAF982_08900 [Pseudomonadota bacterium]